MRLPSQRCHVAIVVIVLLTLGACAQREASPLAPATETQTEVKSQQQSRECTPGKEWWRALGLPKRGGELVMGSSLFDHLDMSKPGRIAGINQVYNGLVEYRACFFGDYSPVTPRLAKSWEVSTDAKTWTFRLRSDVKWQNLPPVNGRTFTAADVAWTIEHQQKDGLLRAFWQGVTYTTPDPFTIVLQLPEADADFIGKVADHRNLIFPHEIRDQKGDFRTVAVGTGAHILKDYRIGEWTLTERNPNYWEAGADGKPLPYLDAVRSISFQDAVAQIAAFRTGKLDFLQAHIVSPQDAQALDRAEQKFQHFTEFFPAVQTVYFTHKTDHPFRNPKVRRAVALAMDRDDLIGAYSGGVPAGFVPPYLFDWAWSEEKVKAKWKPDLAEAKRLLAEAGYPSGFKTTMATAGLYRPGAEVMQQALAKLGIEAAVEEEAGSAFTAVLQRGRFEIAYGAYPGSAFPNFWVGDFIRSGSSLNFLGINNPRIDALVAGQAKELDRTKRLKALDALQEYLHEDLPYLPGISHLYHHFFSCKVKNAKQTLTTYNNPMAVDAWLDPTGC